VDDARIVVTKAKSEKYDLSQRRHSTASPEDPQRDISSCSPTEINSSRRYSMQPEVMKLRESKTGNGNSRSKSACNSAKSSPLRQATLQVPPFQPSFSNRLTVPLPNDLVPPAAPPITPKFRSVAPPNNKMSQSSASVSRRRLRAQQLRRQKSVDVTTQDESTEAESSIPTSPIVNHRPTTTMERRQSLMCSHCAKSLDHLDTNAYLWSEAFRQKAANNVRQALSVDTPTRSSGASTTALWMNEQIPRIQSLTVDTPTRGLGGASTTIWMDEQIARKTERSKSMVKVTHL
jgi:phage FluMu protein Com